MLPDVSTAMTMSAGWSSLLASLDTAAHEPPTPVDPGSPVLVVENDVSPPLPVAVANKPPPEPEAAAAPPLPDDAAAPVTPFVAEHAFASAPTIVTTPSTLAKARARNLIVASP